jgi:hypothetical protein
MNDFTDAEIMVLIGVLNSTMERNGATLQHTSRTPNNPVRTFTTPGPELVRKFLTEAMKRGILKPPTCWNPPC